MISKINIIISEKHNSTFPLKKEIVESLPELVNTFEPANYYTRYMLVYSQFISNEYCFDLPAMPSDFLVKYL